MEHTTIRIDKDTKARLKLLAGEVPMARYLRELLLSLDDTPIDSPTEKHLTAIEKKIDCIIDGGYMRVTADGGVEGFQVLDGKSRKRKASDRG